jgi:hypothetical protein
MTDPLTDQLRAAFDAEPVTVSPDALGTIRRRVSDRTRRRRRTTITWASLATAAAAGVAAVLIGLTSAPPAPGPIGVPSDTPPTTSAGPTAPAGVTDRVPVYFVGTFDGRAVLFREFRPVDLAEDTLVARLDQAVRLAVAGTAADPDYRTGWPAGVTVGAVSVSDGVAVVNLTGPEGDAMAVQQLVYTVTAVASDYGAGVAALRIVRDGVAGPDQVRGPSLDTLAPVWLISPQQDDTVPPEFDVHVAGSVFEATVRVRVRDQAGTLVHDDSVLLNAGAPQRGEAHVPLTLAPGQYTVEVYFLSARDGSEVGADGHAITVR